MKYPHLGELAQQPYDLKTGLTGLAKVAGFAGGLEVRAISRNHAVFRDPAI